MPEYVPSVTFSAGGPRLTAAADDSERRTLHGGLVEWNKPGKTSRGMLRVADGALRFPDQLSDVKLTREHDRGASRGHLSRLERVTGGLRAVTRVSDGPEGDQALAEAMDRTRDAYSVDLEDVRLVGDTIVDALVVAIGQVGIPAFGTTRIDRVAASNPTEGTNTVNPEQLARLAALRAQETLTQAEALELSELVALEASETITDAAATATEAPPATERVAASMPATPAGAPRPRAAATTTPRRSGGGQLRSFAQAIVDHYRTPDTQRVTAALSDVTQTGVGGDVEAPGWSGELWSGVSYEPIFTPMVAAGPLTNYEGNGWRWVTKPVMADYAGDKAAIPSAALDTEASSYEAARLAVGHDFDRKFYDFPSVGFIESYLEACRESWAVQVDAKVEDYILATAVDLTATVSGGGDVFKAVAKAMRYLRRTRVGKGTFVILADADYDNLMDVTGLEVPAFLELFGVNPGMFESSADQVAGTVTVGAKQAVTLRTLPGSPIRVSAQNLANGGVDEAFFGYYAFELHHETGIITVDI